MIATCSGHIDRSSERCIDESRKCIQIDGTQGAFAGDAPDRKNPVDLAKPAANVLTSLLTQDEPS